MLPVVLHAEAEYAERLPEALVRPRKCDPADAHGLALAWALGLPLWSNDRDFEGQAVERYATARLLRSLEA
jgi:predicted nucleic acid-binding protein